MEAVVDAYDEEGRATGWYYYLEEKLTFPFNAKCISRRMISPLLVGEEVEVLDNSYYKRPFLSISKVPNTRRVATHTGH